ncbi:MAG: MGMT family protein [Candidatus Kapaibacteriota bacterium]
MHKDFISKVLEIVAQIPYGKVTTYGAIAEKCGMKSSARMVGWVLSSHYYDRDLPFHRVVNRNGELTGKFHFLTPTLMKELLVSEGVEFIDEKVNMNSYFWKP